MKGKRKPPGNDLKSRTAAAEEIFAMIDVFSETGKKLLCVMVELLLHLPKTKGMLTIEETAEYLGMSIGSVYNLMHSGALEPVYNNSRPTFRIEDVEKLRYSGQLLNRESA